ncbi:reverse transcriptase domain-containing protein [Tanacetum coccineum]
MLQRCKDAHLILNWEKCHFMVKEGIVLGHKVSRAGLEVDKAKINVISQLPPPTNIKGIRSFLRHVGFYRRLIKDFSKIARPLTKLLEKDTLFEFVDECLNAFNWLKEKLTSAPVIISLNWNLLFEFMCDASDFAVGAVFGQKDGKNFHLIYSASKTLNTAQQKYTVTEKELMVVVFTFENFQSYMSESFKSSTQHSFVNEFVVINIPEEDVEPKQIILDPDDQPMWENAKTVAPTPNSAIIQLDVDDNFVINSTHLKMILENKFDGYLRADPHDHIREFLAICDMFKYGETQSEAVKLLILPYSLSDKAKTWFNELNEESITSWEQMRKAFINRFFPPSLIESHKSSTQHPSVNDFVVINIPEDDVEPKQIILDPDDQPMWESARTVAPTPNSAIVQIDVDDNFVINSTHLKLICKNKFDGYLRADPHDHIREFLAICNMFRYGKTQSEAVKLLIFPFPYEPTQGTLDVVAGGIFLYKSPNQAFQFLKDRVLSEHDWPIKSQNDHHQKSVSFTDGSDSNTDNSQLMKKLKAMDSQIISLNKELQDMREKYKELREGNASKKNINDDTSMCERHEANYIQFEDYHNRNSFDSFSHQSLYDPNDSEKSLTELNNDVRNDREDFKRCVRSMRTVHWKLYDSDDRKTTSVLPNKKSKTVNQEPQSKTNLEKSITKFFDGQRVTNMFFKNNVNDMILKMKQNENNFQTKIKNMEIKIDEWSKSQIISLEQTDRTDPPPPQAHTEHVNAVFTERGKSDDSPKT